MEEVAIRLKKMRNIKGLSQKDFAKELKITQSVISDIENGRRGLSRNVLMALGTQFNVNASWILTGQGDMFMPRQISAFKSAEQAANNVNEALINAADSSDEAPIAQDIHIASSENDIRKNGFLVPILEQGLSAGKGQPLPDDDVPVGYIAVPKELKRYGDKLAALYVNGDSMEPTLQRGDLVVCDSCGWDGEGIYALRMDGCGYVKRLARKPGKLVVISDNPKYETWEEPSESQAVDIIGRVHYTLKHVD